MDARLALPVAVILGAPVLAGSQFGFRFGFVENILVRILLVGAIIYAVLEDVFLGLVVFLAVFTLLLERNHAVALTIGSKPLIVNNLESYVKISAPPLALRREQTETNTSNEIGDSNPRLSPAPERSDSGAFFKRLGLL
jgi:hypothetical protein